MSIHTDLMAAGAELQSIIQGDSGESVAIEYRSPAAPKFKWTGSSVGAVRGGVQMLDNGDVLKVSRRKIKGPTSVLVANGVKQLERDATAVVDGLEWAVDLEESSWGEFWVSLELVRRPISRHEEMQAKAERR